MTSIAEVVRRLVDSNPCISESMAKGYVNYTELARKLQPLVEAITGHKPSLEAVKMALVRYSERMGRLGTVNFPVLEILARSALELRTNIVVATLRLEAMSRLMQIVAELTGKARFLAVMQSLNTVTVIVDEEHFSPIENKLRNYIVDVIKGQSAVVIVSPREIITTPGFVAYITSLLARHQINITQIESCHTDTVLILDQENALRAFQILEEALTLAKKALEHAYKT